jgi:hypothetical protein
MDQPQRHDWREVDDAIRTPVGGGINGSRPAYLSHIVLLPGQPGDHMTSAASKTQGGRRLASLASRQSSISILSKNE